MTEPREKGKPRGRNGGRKALPADQRRRGVNVNLSPAVRRWIATKDGEGSKLIEAAILEKFGAEIQELTEPPEPLELSEP